MKLWEEKKLSLDQPVFGEKGILNDSAFLGIKDPRIREITVEHLLRHQGGYSIRAGDPLFCTPSVAQSMQTIWCVSPHRHGSASGPGKEMPIRTSVTWYWAK